MGRVRKRQPKKGVQLKTPAVVTVEPERTDPEGTAALLAAFLQGSTERQEGHDMVLVTLNIAQLTAHKLTILLHYMTAYNVDILCLQDVRLTIAQAKFLKKRALAHMGTGSIAKASILAPHPDSESLRHNNRVGGQLILVQPRWGRRCTSSWADDSGLGLAAGLTFSATSQRQVQVINTYWPIPNRDSEMDTLWSRVTAWMARNRKHGSPLTHLQNLIKCKLHAFLAQPSTVNILVGDLNASLVGNGGTHRQLEEWTQEAVLCSGLSEHEEETTYIRWSGPANPTGHIDHVLYSPGRGAEHMGTFIHEEPLWYDITDHRPVRTIFKLDT